LKIKIVALDKKASRACRERDDYICQRCGTKHATNSSGLHAAHIMPRRHKNTRWHLDNLISLCFGCHRWFDEQRFASAEWMEARIGKEKVIWLRIQANTTWDKDTYKWKIYLDNELGNKIQV